MRLKSHAHPIPNGFRFMVAETNWSVLPWSSFESCVTQIIQHRAGNAWITQSKGWSLDPARVAAELDAFNTKVCQEMNWTDYIVQGEPENWVAPAYTDPPAPPPRQLLSKCCGAK